MQRSRLLLFLLLFGATCLELRAQQHPLDALTADEMVISRDVIHAHPQCPVHARFVTVALREPDKATLQRIANGSSSVLRESATVLLDRERNRCFEVVVNLSTKTVSSWKQRLVQPMVLYEEYDMVDDIVKRDSAYVAGLGRRGITDTNDVVVDAWAAGAIQLPETPNARLMRAVSYLRGTQTNFYGRPIEGLIAIVNLNTQKVVRVIDTGVIPLAPPSEELGSTRGSESKDGSTQPRAAATTFATAHNEVRWHNWNFRFTMHPREGLVLQSVKYRDGNSYRSVLHRVSLSEMVVPYGDTATNWIWRNAFDVGEYGIGNLTFPMDTLNDAPEGAQFVDAVLADNDGNPVLRKNVMTLYERDGGLLWKHYEQYSGRNESRRTRELVLSSIATVGNYDYAINYVFRDDGSVNVEAQLTGIMLPKGVVDTVVSPHEQYGGHLVTKRVLAPNHQHFFCFRIDADIDGEKNNVSEIDAWAPPANSRENPNGNAIVMDEQFLRHEREGVRTVDTKRARCWRVSNNAYHNRIGETSSYILVPGANAFTFLDTANIVRKRAGFLNYHLWATSYKPEEMYAAGDYPNQSKGGDGLPRFVKDNESIENCDVVLWYTMGISHLPRAEEFPVMNVHRASFSLVPAGFFDENPALKVEKNK